MKRPVHSVLISGILLISTAVFGGAQELKLFPGSRLDEKASAAASQAVPGKESKVYTTSESYDKVLEFYKSAYKQDASMPATGPKLASGQQIRWAFFIIDGGAKLSNSNYWMKIQHPYVGGTDGKDIRDVTVIQSVRKK